MQHLGSSHRRWAATVAAGPADVPPGEAEWTSAPEDRKDLLAWSERSTGLLVDALRQAGPDRGVWTWWDGSQSPSTASAVARHTSCSTSWCTRATPRP